ncbi:troponin T, fast skeletal muscle [Gracilinanus agilis]|uniref:troponin T, fast skeletal muscle n=1 Tax=Gracilinanus agilis TaxID=191870 RepID=UPI001CFF3376|nr:troponin T, fast skeletal muscle [Gracilinanus agilis]
MGARKARLAGRTGRPHGGPGTRRSRSPLLPAAHLSRSAAAGLAGGKFSNISFPGGGWARPGVVSLSFSKHVPSFAAPRGSCGYTWSGRRGWAALPSLGRPISFGARSDVPITRAGGLEGGQCQQPALLLRAPLLCSLSSQKPASATMSDEEVEQGEEEYEEEEAQEEEVHEEGMDPWLWNPEWGAPCMAGNSKVGAGPGQPSRGHVDGARGPGPPE